MAEPVDERLATGRVTVDLGAIGANWQEMARRSGSAQTGAAVKADAYGLGLNEVGATLHKAGCRHFFVATPDEGVRLRRVAGDAEIFVLAGLTPDAAPARLVRRRLADPSTSSCCVRR